MSKTNKLIGHFEDKPATQLFYEQVDDGVSHLPGVKKEVHAQASYAVKRKFLWMWAYEQSPVRRPPIAVLVFLPIQRLSDGVAADLLGPLLESGVPAYECGVDACDCLGECLPVGGTVEKRVGSSRFITRKSRGVYKYTPLLLCRLSQPN